MLWISTCLRYLNILVFIFAPYFMIMICHDVGFFAIPAGNVAAAVAGVGTLLFCTIVCGLIGLLFSIYDRLAEISLMLAKGDTKNMLEDINQKLNNE